jgi:hypothetical protein
MARGSVAREGIVDAQVGIVNLVKDVEFLVMTRRRDETVCLVLWG